MKCDENVSSLGTLHKFQGPNSRAWLVTSHRACPSPEEVAQDSPAPHLPTGPHCPFPPSTWPVAGNKLPGHSDPGGPSAPLTRLLSQKRLIYSRVPLLSSRTMGAAPGRGCLTPSTSFPTPLIGENAPLFQMNIITKSST